MDFGFIITRKIINESTSQYWIENVKQIRKFYTNQIVIIDDNSSTEYLQDEEIKNREQLENVIFIYNTEKYYGKGEILGYFYFYKYRFFEKAIIIHDSVFIQNKISKLDEIKDVRFLWNFYHNWDDWPREREILSKLNNSEELIEVHKDHHLWNGCFGVMSVIQYDFLDTIVNKYNFFVVMNDIHDRGDRCCIERVFGVICNYELKELKKDETLYGNIHHFMCWGYSYQNYLDDKDTLDKEIVKIWSGR